MQIKLSYKLFGAFVLILAIVAGAMELSRTIFSRNFKEYIHQVEREKMKSLVPVLQEEYRSKGGWQDIASNPGQWRRLMRTVPEIREEIPPPPPRRKAPGGLMPRPDGPHPPPTHMASQGPPGILLLDAEKRPVVGMPGSNDQTDLVSIEVDGQIVGWLGLHRREPFKSGPPAALLERQTRHIYLLSGAVIVLTALIAFLFSRHLLKPVKRLTQGTRELTNRNFSARIPPGTRDELGQLADNFNAMAHTLENFEKTRRQWLTDISHELRTPLAILRGEIEALQEGIREPTPQNLGSLHAEILRLSRLVEDLHLLSMADSDSLFLDIKRISPGEVLKKIALIYQPRFDQCRIDLKINLNDIKDVRIWGDNDRLEQVFTNILENACKYVPSGGSIRISGTAEGNLLNLNFEDSGPGVSETDLPRLFERLYRVDGSRNRGSGGSGLGLSICRHIIEHHDGNIWAEKSPMGGLSIFISLPLNKRKED